MAAAAPHTQQQQQHHQQQQVHRSIAELEQLLERTLQQPLGLDLGLGTSATALRVPTSKDAMGAGAPDGPFDISDMWAEESLPSVSQSDQTGDAAVHAGALHRDPAL